MGDDMEKATAANNPGEISTSTFPILRSVLLCAWLVAISMAVFMKFSVPAQTLTSSANCSMDMLVYFSLLCICWKSTLEPRGGMPGLSK